MKAICTKNFLQKASLLSEKITVNNPTLPILNAVLISTNENSLVFSSTNLEIGLEISIPAKIKKEGKIAVPSKVFSNLISSLFNDGDVELNSMNNSLVLTTANSSTNMKGFPVEDFPILPNIKSDTQDNVNVHDFILGLKSVYYATSLSEMKPEINSVFVSSSNKIPLTFAATDSFRLAEKVIDYKISNFPNFLLPHKSVAEIIRIFDNEDGDIQIESDDNNIVLKSSRIKFTSRLTNGKFIDYKEVIPTDFTDISIVSKKEFGDALKSAMVFSGRFNELRIRVYKNENFMELQTNNPETGEHIVSVKSDNNGRGLNVVFNYRYISDCLSFFNSEKIAFKFSDEGKSLLITGVDDNSFNYLVLPMKDI